MKVFLGGTCNNSQWREELMPMLDCSYFNPVVEDWTPECQAEEERQKEICDYLLYVITPQMKGVYSIAEVVNDSNNQKKTTLFCVLPEYEGEKFDEAQLKSLDAVKNMVKNNGAQICTSLRDIAGFLNTERLLERFK